MGIKFRAWDSIDKKMYYPETADHDGVHRGIDVPGFIEFGLFAVSLTGKPIQVESDTYMRSPTFPVVEVKNDIILMQFTGLQDKNGRDIYIGDRLEYIDHQHPEKPDRYTVEWRNNGFVGVWDGDKDYNNKDNDGLIDCHKDISVIGNIYEK